MKRALPTGAVVIALIMGVNSPVAVASTKDTRPNIADLVDDTIVNSRHSYTVPDVTKTVTTEDGLTVTLTKKREEIHRSAPLTSNPFSHEAHITMQGIAEVKGGKPNAQHTLTTGYLIGCQIDASEPVQLKAEFPIKVNPFSPFFALGRDSTVTEYKDGIADNSKFGFPKLGAALGFTSGFKIANDIAYWTTVRPGRINKVPLSSYNFQGNKISWTDFRNLHLYIDGCPGNVSLRSYVEFVSGADIPSHYRQQPKANPKLEAPRAPKTSRVRFAQATEKLERVENKALKLSTYEPDQSLNGLGSSNSDRFSTEKPEKSDQPNPEREKVQREMESLSKPTQETLTSPYGNSAEDQIEGLKFTIHGAVRWMSTLLPQTSLEKDRRNRKRVMDSQIAPIRSYSDQVERELTKQQVERRSHRHVATRKEDQQ